MTRPWTTHNLAHVPLFRKGCGTTSKRQRASQQRRNWTYVGNPSKTFKQFWIPSLLLFHSTSPNTHVCNENLVHKGSTLLA